MHPAVDISALRLMTTLRKLPAAMPVRCRRRSDDSTRGEDIKASSARVAGRSISSFISLSFSYIDRAMGRRPPAGNQSSKNKIFDSVFRENSLNSRKLGGKGLVYAPSPGGGICARSITEAMVRSFTGPVVPAGPVLACRFWTPAKSESIVSGAVDAGFNGRV